MAAGLGPVPSPPQALPTLSTPITCGVERRGKALALGGLRAGLERAGAFPRRRVGPGGTRRPKACGKNAVQPSTNPFSRLSFAPSQVRRAGDRQGVFADDKDRHDVKLIPPAVERAFYAVIQPLVDGLIRSRTHPNTIT